MINNRLSEWMDELTDDSDTRKAHLILLIRMACADGKIHPKEKAALHRAAANLDLPLDETVEDDESMSMWRTDLASKLPQSRSERAAIIADCIILSMIDGEVAQAELVSLHFTAEILGFSREETRTIAEMVDSGCVHADIREAFS